MNTGALGPRPAETNCRSSARGGASVRGMVVVIVSGRPAVAPGASTAAPGRRSGRWTAGTGGGRGQAEQARERGVGHADATFVVDDRRAVVKMVEELLPDHAPWALVEAVGFGLLGGLGQGQAQPVRGGRIRGQPRLDPGRQVGGEHEVGVGGRLGRARRSWREHQRDRRLSRAGVGAEPPRDIGRIEGRRIAQHDGVGGVHDQR